MATIETWFNQDLKEAVKVRYIDGNVFSADNNGNLVGVNVFDDGLPASLGGTVSANIIRADGVTVAATGVLSDNKCYVILPQSAYSVPGVISIIIKLTNGSDITTVCAVVSNVYISSTDTVVDPGTIIPSVETLIAEIETAVASIPADYSSLWTSLAPAFSSSANYVPGDVVTYDGSVYVFVKHHSGTWASADVMQSTVGGLIKENSDYITRQINDALTETIEAKIIPITNKNRYVDLSGSTVTMENGSPKISGTTTVYSCSIVACTAGDAFTINGRGGTSTRLWGFVDASGNILDVCDASKIYYDMVVFAPVGSAFLIYHTHNATAIASYYGNVIRVSKDIRFDNNTNILKGFADYRIQSPSGITFTWDDDKRICTMTGTATGSAMDVLWSYTDGIPDGMKAGEMYQIVMDKDTGLQRCGIRIYIKHSDDSVTNRIYVVSQFIKIPADAVGISIMVYVPSGFAMPENGSKIEFGMYYVSGFRHNLIMNQTEETLGIPYNVIPLFTQTTSPYTANGITFTWNDDFTVLNLNGTASGSAMYFISSYENSMPEEVVPGKKYKITFNASIESKINFRIVYQDSDGNLTRTDYYTSTYIDVPADTTGISIIVKVVSGTVCSNDTAEIKMTLVNDDSVTKENGGGNPDAYMIAWGSSFMAGAIYPDGTLDHICSFENSPWGNISIALGIPEANARFNLKSGTGLLYDAGYGNILDAIEATDLSKYDYILTEINRPDLGTSSSVPGFPLGDLSSTAGDGSIVGAVLELLAYMKTSNPNATLILLGAPPSSHTPGYCYNDVFTGVYQNGSSIADSDIMMHRLAVREHFIFVDWEDLNLSYYYPDLTYQQSNLHPMSDSTCRAMGLYAARCLSYSSSLAKVLKADS